MPSIQQPFTIPFSALPMAQLTVVGPGGGPGEVTASPQGRAYLLFDPAFSNKTGAHYLDLLPCTVGVWDLVIRVTAAHHSPQRAAVAEAALHRPRWRFPKTCRTPTTVVTPRALPTVWPLLATHLFKPWRFQPSLALIEEEPHIEEASETISRPSLRTRVTSWFTKSLFQPDSGQHNLVVPTVAPPLLVLSVIPHLGNSRKEAEGGISRVSGSRIVQIGGPGFLTALDTRRRITRAGDPVVATQSSRTSTVTPESGAPSSYMA